MEGTTLGQRIRALRHERGLTQRQLAQQAGVDYTYLSKIENERLEHTPSLRALRDLARALETDELELLDLANKVPPFLESIVRNKEALRFFRRASESITTTEGWRDLQDYLDRREKGKRGGP